MTQSLSISITFFIIPYTYSTISPIPVISTASNHWHLLRDQKFIFLFWLPHSTYVLYYALSKFCHLYSGILWHSLMMGFTHRAAFHNIRVMWRFTVILPRRLELHHREIKRAFQEETPRSTALKGFCLSVHWQIFRITVLKRALDQKAVWLHDAEAGNPLQLRDTAWSAGGPFKNADGHLKKGFFQTIWIEIFWIIGSLELDSFLPCVQACVGAAGDWSRLGASWPLLIASGFGGADRIYLKIFQNWPQFSAMFIFCLQAPISDRFRHPLTEK